MSKVYSCLYKSLVRAVNDLALTLPATYWSWESRGDEDQMPRENLVGLSGMSWQENGDLWVIRFGVTISTVDDAHLHVEADYIDHIHEAFGFGNRVVLRDPESGTVIDDLTVTDFDVMPAERTQQRNYRTIGVELLRG